MRKPRLQPGDRVRAKARTIFGWKGTGVVLSVSSESVCIKKDDTGGEAMFCADQLAKIRAPKGGDDAQP